MWINTDPVVSCSSYSSSFVWPHYHPFGYTFSSPHGVGGVNGGYVPVTVEREGDDQFLPALAVFVVSMFFIRTRIAKACKSNSSNQFPFPFPP